MDQAVGSQITPACKHLIQILSVLAFTSATATRPELLPVKDPKCLMEEEQYMMMITAWKVPDGDPGNVTFTQLNMITVYY